MAATDTPDDWGREYCPACDAETPHDVSIEIRNQSSAGVPEADRPCGRSPYRVTDCQDCGHTQVTRIVHWDS